VSTNALPGRNHNSPFNFRDRCIVFISPAISQRGNTGIAMLYATLFFESICFPTIVALGMRGLGKYSKRGSGFLVAGVAGGAVVPPALGAAADASSTAHAMAVPLGFFVLAWTYSLTVNFVPAYRNPVDMMGHAEIGIKNTGRNDEEIGRMVQQEVGDLEKVRAVAHPQGGLPEISEVKK
jgi:FHS family L-fucose permease-like MFS transporter